MDRRANVVIGANYGDESKGAAVDRLTRGADTLVVRFNGGAQAGHTVVTPDGRRHVFHHVGSGAFHGAATFLSRYFVSNPMALEDELVALKRIGVTPRILADRRGLLTTPFDMLINQIVEASRGRARHGSCGYGFGETIERYESGFGTTLANIEDRTTLRSTLIAIRDRWTPIRLSRLGVREIPSEYRSILADDDLVESFVEAADGFANAVSIDSDWPLRTADDIVLEGAQGLLLDQRRGAFPHVTRSNTGIENALALASETGINRLEVTYATRCYLTRHGAGPLPGELNAPPLDAIVDETNVPNAWQGAIRYALLDVDLLRERIHEDLSDAEASDIAVTPRVAVSCLDQTTTGAIQLVASGREIRLSPSAVACFVAHRLEFNSANAAFGPTRDDAVEMPIGTRQFPVSKGPRRENPTVAALAACA